MRRRTRIGARTAGLLLIVALVLLSASDVAADVWHRVVSDTGPLARFGPIERGLQYRERWYDADVHVVMWFIGGLVVLLQWCRTFRQRVVVTSLMFVGTVAIEWGQGVVTSTRTPSKLDVVGGGLGLGLAFVTAEFVVWVRARRAATRTPVG